MPAAAIRNAEASGIAHAVAADDVAGRVGAGARRERERDEGEAGQQRARAEHVLQVERAEQEEAEDRAGRGEHQEHPPPTARSASRSTRRSGFSVRRSQAAKMPSPARASAASPSVWVEPQPAWSACVIAIDERAEAGGAEQGAGDVEPAPARAFARRRE